MIVLCWSLRVVECMSVCMVGLALSAWRPLLLILSALLYGHVAPDFSALTSACEWSMYAVPSSLWSCLHGSVHSIDILYVM